MEVLLYNNKPGDLIQGHHLTSQLIIPDVCQHKPSYQVQESRELTEIIPNKLEISTDKLTGSCELSDPLSTCHNPVLKSKDTDTTTQAESEASCTDERMALVSSQALRVRQNGVRLVAKSPRSARRGTPIVEIDRRWALGQCEELTTWVNSVLQTRGKTLEADLKKSISDGYTLPLLLSALSEDFEVHDCEVRSQQGQFERVRTCLQHLKNLGYTCPEVSASDIVNGDLKALILFLSGLKNFFEQRNEKKSEELTGVETMRSTATSLRTRSLSRERATPQSRSSETDSISDRLKRILQDDTPSVNVDSGEKEVVVNESSTRQLPSDLCRGQPSGDSDSAASPHSNNEDSLDKRVDSNYTRLQQQQQQQWQQQQSRGRQLYDSNVQTQQQERSLSSQSRYSTGKQGHTYPHPHSRYSVTEPQSIPNSRSSHDPSLYNTSVPNLHSYPSTDQVRAAPRSMTPTPGSSKLSVYTSYAVQQDTVAGGTNSGQTDRVMRGRSRAGKADLYAPSSAPRSSPRSSYSQRRQLQSSAGLYERIDGGQVMESLPVTTSTNTITSTTTSTTTHSSRTPTNTRSSSSTSNTSATTTETSRLQLPDYQTAVRCAEDQTERSDQQKPTERMPFEGIPPDVKYDSSQRRRVSMPAARHYTPAANLPPAANLSSRAKPVVAARRLSSTNHTIQSKQSNSDDDYVDISDIEEDINGAAVDDERCGTPPLPPLLGGEDNLETGSCDSEPQANRKYLRSVSVSPKMLSADITRFQQQQEDHPNYSTRTTQISSPNKSNLVISPEYVEDKAARNLTFEPSDTPVSAREAAPAYHTATRKGSSRRERTETQPHYGVFQQKEDNSHQYDDKLDKQVQKLERLYEDMSLYLSSSKHGAHRHRDRDGRRNSVASATSSQYSYSHRHRKQRPYMDSKAINKRFLRLESHISTIARSISFLSSEVKSASSLTMEVERLAVDLEYMKQQLSCHIGTQQSSYPFEGRSQGPPPLPAENPTTGVNDATPQKISKLTKLKSSFRRRFFGQEPPLMKMFLKELGYEKYLPIFEGEKIGVMELPYMSEERLLELGLPLGPCIRILQEVARFSSFRAKQRQNKSASNKFPASGRSSRVMN